MKCIEVRYCESWAHNERRGAAFTYYVPPGRHAQPSYTGRGGRGLQMAKPLPVHAACSRA